MESNLEIDQTSDNNKPQQPRGYRNYDPNPNTPTGVVNPSADLAGTGYEALVAAIAWRLEAHSPTKRARKVIAIDLYHSPYIDEFITQFKQSWESAQAPRNGSIRELR